MSTVKKIVKCSVVQMTRNLSLPNVVRQKDRLAKVASRTNSFVDSKSVSWLVLLTSLTIFS